MRIGSGFDVHAFGPGDHVMLGGVRVPHTHAVIAHSDGDVLLHALCDALLGAAGLGDIGQHFKDTDPKWRGADSTLLRHRGARNAQGAQFRRGERRSDAHRPGPQARPLPRGDPQSHRAAARDSSPRA